MRIGELARETGVSERALRYYEEQGLLRPERRPSGYRVYRAEDVAAVRRIRTLLAAGLSTAQILQVWTCIVDVEDMLAPGCPEVLDGLLQQRARIDEAIDELATTRANLEVIIAGERRAAALLPVPAAAGSSQEA